MSETVISTPEELGAFRASYTGEVILRLLREASGFLLVNWWVGVGKSYNIDNTIEHAIRSGLYDLVICLVPLRRIIQERRWILDPPDDLKIVDIKPRPKQKCGPARNDQWKMFEQNQLGALGKQEICKICPEYNRCPWPSQYGSNLKGASVVYATQAHLNRSSSFIQDLISWVEAENPLLIFDEDNFFMGSFEKSISRDDLSRFLNVMNIIDHSSETHVKKLNKEWLYCVEVLEKARTSDLRCNDWQFPFMAPPWRIEVQRIGYETFGEDFKFVGYDIKQIQASLVEYRVKAESGDIKFSVRPTLECDSIIYSASTHPDFIRYRLNKDFGNPFEKYRFIHEGTCWNNISSRMGMRAYFDHNKYQILSFFARLVVKRYMQGKRVLLISKKCFVNDCAQWLQSRFSTMKETGLQVVTDNLEDCDFENNPGIIPLIGYGTKGVNHLQVFDCTFCLNGYYVNEDVVNTILQDIIPGQDRIPLEISMDRGSPLRRTIRAERQLDRVYDVHTMAQKSLDYLEMETVIQAVGRVRPFTKPREIITFQCSHNPCMEYTQDFLNLDQARIFFEIPADRQQAKENIIQNVKQCRQTGMTQKQSAEALTIGLRTVKRYWND